MHNNSTSAAHQLATNDNEFEAQALEIEVNMIQADLIHFLQTGTLTPRPWTTPEQMRDAEPEGDVTPEEVEEDKQKYAQATERLCVKLEAFIAAQRQITAETAQSGAMPA